MALRDVRLSQTTLSEMQRLAQPGSRITYANAHVEGFDGYVNQLRQAFPNGKVASQGTVTGSDGIVRNVVVIELPR
jgi:hypothetical protein